MILRCRRGRRAATLSFYHERPSPFGRRACRRPSDPPGPAGRAGVYLRHGHARRAGAGHHRARADTAGPVDGRRQRGGHGQIHRYFRHGVGGDAIHRRPGARRGERPLRPPPGGAVVQPRVRAGLHHHGPGAEPGLALRRAARLRFHDRQHSDRLRLPRGRDPARETFPGLRGGRRGLRDGVHRGAGAGRRARADRRAAAVLGVGGPVPGQRVLRPVRAAGIAAPRTAGGVFLAAREPGGGAGLFAFAPRGARADGGAVFLLPRARDFPECVRALRGYPLRPERTDGRPDAGQRGRLLGPGADGAHQEGTRLGR